MIEHGGNLFRFHALATLLPERNVGIFVAYNSYGEGGDFAGYELMKAFMDRYYPEAPPETTVSATDAIRGTSGDAERVAGGYRSTRSNQTGFEKVFALLGPASVTANEDGSITTSGVPSRGDIAGGEQRWVQDGPLLFRAKGGDEHLAFREDGEGRLGVELYLGGPLLSTSNIQRAGGLLQAPGRAA